MPYVANSTFFDDVNGTHDRFLKSSLVGGSFADAFNSKRSSIKQHGLLGVANSTNFPRNRSTLSMHKSTALSTHLNARASMKRPSGFYKYRPMFNTLESLPNQSSGVSYGE